jgi:hypothetical protein
VEGGEGTRRLKVPAGRPQTRYNDSMSETLAGSVLPTLYKKTSTGAIQQWRVWSDGGSVYTEPA